MFSLLSVASEIETWIFYSNIPSSEFYCHFQEDSLLTEESGECNNFESNLNLLIFIWLYTESQLSFNRLNFTLPSQTHIICILPLKEHIWVILLFYINWGEKFSHLLSRELAPINYHAEEQYWYLMGQWTLWHHVKSLNWQKKKFECCSCHSHRKYQITCYLPMIVE